MAFPWSVAAADWAALGLTGMAGLAALAIGAYCSRAADCYAGLLADGRAADAATLCKAMRLAMPAGRKVRLPSFGHSADRQRFSMAATERLPARAAAAWRPSSADAVLAAGIMALLLLHGCSLHTALAVLAGMLLMLLALIDLRTGLLPDALTLPVLVLGLAAAALDMGAARPAAMGDALSGAVLGLAVPWLLNQLFKRLRGRDGMGGGDFKLLAGLGAWLGWQGLPLALLLACCAGLLWAMWRQKTLLPSGAYPFGPFLSAGGAYVFLAGSGLHWHFW